MRQLFPRSATVAGLMISTALVSACGAQPENQSTAQENAAPLQHDLIQRTPDAANGRALFVDKGCVICHGVNGIGGKAAPPLDAQTELDAIDPVEFSARMWRGAPAMVELQALELGYTIWLDAKEIVDLAAFSADAAEQKKLTDDAISDTLRDSFLNEGFWEVEEWDEFLEEGQERFGEPKPPIDPEEDPNDS